MRSMVWNLSFIRSSNEVNWKRFLLLWVSEWMVRWMVDGWMNYWLDGWITIWMLWLKVIARIWWYLLLQVYRCMSSQVSQWRLNLNLTKSVMQQYVKGGIVIVNSTRKGKPFPDSFNKTISIWCYVVNYIVYYILKKGFNELNIE